MELVLDRHRDAVQRAAQLPSRRFVGEQLRLGADAVNVQVRERLHPRLVAFDLEKQRLGYFGWCERPGGDRWSDFAGAQFAQVK